MLQVSMRLPLGGPDPFGKAPTEDMVLALTYQGHRQVVYKLQKTALILSQHGNFLTHLSQLHLLHIGSSGCPRCWQL